MPDRTSLAIHGGPPAFPQGPPAWPFPDEAVRESLAAAYADGSWGRYDGPHGRRLIEKLQAMHGGAEVLLCSSGTIAVELALRGLKVGSGDEVILAAYDFPGNFRAVEAVGARPALVDLAESSWAIDAVALPDAIGPRTKAIIVSHLHGTLADMPRISGLARAAGVPVIEDACQTPGAIVQKTVAGSWGDIGIHSFGGSKLLTAGRGGALITPHADVAQRIRVYSQRGNEAFPLSELQAAVLAPQLEKLVERNERRGAAVQLLAERSPGNRLVEFIAEERDGWAAAYYKLGMLYRPSCDHGEPVQAVQRRQRFTAAVRAEGVAIDEGFRGFARRSAGRCRVVGSLTRAERAAQATVVLHHPVLLQDAATIERVAAAIGKVAEALAADDRGR